MSEIQSLIHQEQEAWARLIDSVFDYAEPNVFAKAKQEWQTAKINLQNGTFDYVQSIL